MLAPTFWPVAKFVMISKQEINYDLSSIHVPERHETGLIIMNILVSDTQLHTHPSYTLSNYAIRF